MRQGIGRELVEDAATRALAKGRERMTVVAHPRTFPFYESVGFVPGEPTPIGHQSGWREAANDPFCGSARRP